ncbi:MAG: flagellar biosynthesis protein FlhF [Lachnospiraceae bacterium]|nr:flagellar biosynthesis protein FlhF [Lachnospiraceae bacterium]
MIIKKYQGKTEEDAMKLAVAELGESCVLMNTKVIKQKGIMKLFKASTVEVTVALEEEEETNYEHLINPINVNLNNDRTIYTGFNQVVSDDTVINSIKIDNNDKSNDVNLKETVLPKEENLSQTNNSLEIKNIEKEEVAEPVASSETSKESSQDVVLENGIDAVYDLIYQTLVDNEVDEKYVEEIITETKNRLKNNTPMDTVLAHIYQRLILRFGEPQTIEGASNGPKVVFFVGPTGVGKTTTIAKIASKLFISGNKVALFTSDTYRIAAAEQLHSYANIMTVPFRIIYTLDDFEESLESFKEYDYILVDTVGHSHKNTELKENMKKFIDLSKIKAETEVYLVLAASTKMKDLIHIADSYKEITDYRLIFTKLDETYSYGTIYNLKMHTNANLSYVTNGQNVPDDIDTFKPQQIVKKLLGGK